ncbi:hypothetical protein NEOLEDRAFT_1143990 [Neolentinus lepideus HHB14362 ss-1]|uniref:Uncharacterized protein n=1 Tax=Neolentinus lepideus HHB14362 ss-1 TaxID=1314782 RepID=A0A165M5Q5_9AGAM|nr:hypothetical protein NEOLEDRAFT_1143990 [Neolentinus lepideus HHB14362 ss-1]
MSKSMLSRTTVGQFLAPPALDHPQRWPVEPRSRKIQNMQVHLTKSATNVAPAATSYCSSIANSSRPKDSEPNQHTRSTGTDEEPYLSGMKEELLETKEYEWRKKTMKSFLRIWLCSVLEKKEMDLKGWRIYIKCHRAWATGALDNISASLDADRLKHLTTIGFEASDFDDEVWIPGAFEPPTSEVVKLSPRERQERVIRKLVVAIRREKDKMEEARRQDEKRRSKEEQRRARHRGNNMNRDREHEPRGRNIQCAILVRSEKPDSQHNRSMTHADSNDTSHPVAPRQSASPKHTQPPVSTPSAADADKSIVSVQQPLGPSVESSAATVREDVPRLSPLIIPMNSWSDVPCDDNRPELKGISPEMRPKVAEQDGVPGSKIATEEQSQAFAIETASDAVLSDPQPANAPEAADARPSSTASCDGALQTQPEDVDVVRDPMTLHIPIGMDYDALNEIYARAFAHVLAQENEEDTSDDEEDLTLDTSNLDILPITSKESASYTWPYTAFPDSVDLRQKLEHDAKQFEIWNDIYAQAFAQVIAEENAEVDDDYESDEEQPCPPRIVRPATRYLAMDISFQAINEGMMQDAPDSEEDSCFTDRDMSILEDLFEFQDTYPMEIEAEAEPMTIDGKDEDEDGDVSMMTVEPAAVMDDAVAELCKLLKGCLRFR